jgi:hypothetical protein
MNEKPQITLTLTDEAMEILNKHASPRKRGEFVSKLLVEWAAGQDEADRSGILESMARRLERIEKILKAERQP